MLELLRKIFGTPNDRVIKKLSLEVEKINKLEPEFQKLENKDFILKTQEFRERIASGETLDSLLYEAFALVREASVRIFKKRHFDVQLKGGIILHQGMIAEMRTGEGKTLMATLSAYLNALTGKGVHVITVNDYLATFHAEWMGRLYNFLGLTVGCVLSNMSDQEKQEAYNMDITYGHDSEFGFDFLRDNMKYNLNSKVQRPFAYAIIDEVDSILIDEARTPMILSGQVDDKSDLYVKISKLVQTINESHYEMDQKSRSVSLNNEGISYIENLLIQNDFIESETSLYDFDNMYLVHYINQALRAKIFFKKDVDYIVRNNKVMIIDEFTGRVMDGRRYSDGIHQSIEAKENVPIQNENQTIASITLQNYFRMYPKISGMTGTAMTEAGEFKDIYNLEVVTVPTHHPVKRKDHDDEIYGSKQEKYDAILKQIEACYKKGQPVLVGTISIEKSEEISEILKKYNIPHNVLNAKYHEKEAHIIAQAGRYSAITIATNMAGRGTDIMLGGNAEMLLDDFDTSAMSEEQKMLKLQEFEEQVSIEKKKVIDAGGLFVIGTERHESRRIDNQLRGRSGRQGDPGETKFYLSLDDDLMQRMASDRMAGILRTLGLKDGEAIHHPLINRSISKAQQNVENYNYDIRKNLLKFDDVMNDQRRVVYQYRDEILGSVVMKDIFVSRVEDVVTTLVAEYVPFGSYKDEWDIDALAKELKTRYQVVLDLVEILKSDIVEQDLINIIVEKIINIFVVKERDYGIEHMNEATRYILISTLDHVWKDHLYSLDHLRQGISLRAYGQKDPLMEYKREAFAFFEKMLDHLNELFVLKICAVHIADKINENHLDLSKKEEQKFIATRNDPAFVLPKNEVLEVGLSPFKNRVSPEERKSTDMSTWGRVSRNELCPCGSNKKYKACHGKV